MSRRSFTNCLSVSAIIVAVVTGPSPGAAVVGQDSRTLGSGPEVRWTGVIAPGRTVEVKGVNGSVEARPSTGSQVEVVATKTSRRSDLESVRIEIVEHADGVTFCAVYPDRDDEPNDCRPGSGGRLGARDNDVKVQFVVAVPAGVLFVGRTVNGDVSADGLKADSEAYTVNGTIHLTTTGVARAETVNGSITASMGNADWRDDVEFRTVNGSITLDLPGTLRASLEAETVNGKIDTDFPLTISGRFSPKRIRGTIGATDAKDLRELTVSTVNGSIRLRKGL